MTTIETRTDVFDRVVCGVDPSDSGLLAAKVAGLIASPGGSLVLVAVDDPSLAVHAGWAAAQVLESLAEEARLALQRGRAEVESLHTVEARLLEGDPLRCLLTEIERRHATLAVVGSHGVARTVGIALGAVSTHLLHDAPCSVLVARGAVELDRWPRSLVAGLDGSAESALALVAAREAADRLGARLRVIVATQDSHVDVAAARQYAPEAEVHHGRALDVLNTASETADLVVVGSRGLRGLRSLGSLSERLAHEARCSVLVVRPRSGAASQEPERRDGR